MGLLNYKHKDEEIKKPLHDVDFETPIENDFVYDFLKEELNELSSLEKMNEDVIKELKKSIGKETITVNPLFDSKLISDLNILHGIITDYIPDYPAYYTFDDDGNAQISMKAFIDSRDFLINEMDLDLDSLKNKMNGSDINNDKLYYSNGLSIDTNGIIRRNKKILFDPDRPQDIRVTAIDFEKEIVTFSPGVHVKMIRFGKKPKTEIEKRIIPDQFYKYFIINNPHIIDKSKKKYYFETLDAAKLFKELYIKDGKKILKDAVLRPEYHPLYSSDSGDLQDIKKGMTVCTQKKINYFYLMFLLLIGGGRFNKRPLPGSNNKNATLKQGRVGTIPILALDTNSSNNGCNQKNYKVGHAMMYSDDKPFGMETSILQTIYNMASFIFGLNIPKVRLYIRIKILKHHITIVDWTIIHFTCIGGWLEILLLEIQESISEEIDRLMKCDLTYSTPITDKDGEGLTFISSKTPICKYYNFVTNTCDNPNAPEKNRTYCDISLCLRNEDEVKSVTEKVKLKIPVPGIQASITKGIKIGIKETEVSVGAVVRTVTIAKCPGYTPDLDFYENGRVTLKNSEEQGSAVAAILNGE